MKPMRDREFLAWLHERLREVHNESPYVDYMHKLRAIIRATPADQETPNVACANDLQQLAELIAQDDREQEKWRRKWTWYAAATAVAVWVSAYLGAYLR